jgi:hypothetical protein
LQARCAGPVSTTSTSSLGCASGRANGPHYVVIANAPAEEGGEDSNDWYPDALLYEQTSVSARLASARVGIRWTDDDVDLAWPPGSGAVPTGEPLVYGREAIYTFCDGATPRATGRVV